MKNVLDRVHQNMSLTHLRVLFNDLVQEIYFFHNIRLCRIINFSFPGAEWNESFMFCFVGKLGIFLFLT